MPPDRHPALLFCAASCRLVARDRPQPLAAAFPRPGEPQPPLPPNFAGRYRDFLLDRRVELEALLASHRYQMSEVGRCAQIAPAIGVAARGTGGEAILVDMGTGAGFGLRPDRYGYRYLSRDGERTYGPPRAALVLECRTLGPHLPPLGAPLPRIVHRVGIDVDPVDLDDPEATAWLAACVPPEAESLTRFAAALSLAQAEPAPVMEGDAAAVLPQVLDGLPPGPLLVVVDSYVNVFLPPEEREAIAATLERVGRRRDVAWISLDPLVPLGPDARDSVQGIAVPAALVRQSREEGLFGVLGLVAWRAGRRRDAILARAHPGAAWMEWLE